MKLNKNKKNVIIILTLSLIIGILWCIMTTFVLPLMDSRIKYKDSALCFVVLIMEALGTFTFQLRMKYTQKEEYAKAGIIGAISYGIYLFGYVLGVFELYTIGEYFIFEISGLIMTFAGIYALNWNKEVKNV